jgi:hypothetical protein
VAAFDLRGGLIAHPLARKGRRNVRAATHGFKAVLRLRRSTREKEERQNHEKMPLHIDPPIIAAMFKPCG